MVEGDADDATKEGPEDWMLGLCALTLSKVTLINSGRMFQTGPDSWQQKFLVGRQPVSFHKHDGVQPEEIYRTWFSESDSLLLGAEQRKQQGEPDYKTEL